MAAQNVVAEAYRQASLKTANDLRTIATSGELFQLSQLALPEIDHLTEEVARVVPAGNVPGIILSGLARLGSRQVSGSDSRKQIGLLFKGARQVLDNAVYGTFFAGPAAVLYGYQQLLRLAGKNTDTAFPDGTWQFYLEFALREDGARHTNETTGFHERLQQHHIQLQPSDMLAAWVLTSAFTLNQLPALLANEWLERVAIKLLLELEPSLPDLFGAWDKARPYVRGTDAGTADYPTYRRRIFEAFLQKHLVTLPLETQRIYQAQLREAQQQRLEPYLKQMSWLAYLEPEAHNESRIPYKLDSAFMGIIWQGSYHLLPVSMATDPEQVRAATVAILNGNPQQAATLDETLVTARRGAHPTLRKMQDKSTLDELEKLRRAPILINWDERDAREPLVLLRQGKRGIGDHALTIFRTAESIAFDQSHIFFDGVWGSAIAEIMTNEALSWAVYLSQLPPARPASDLTYRLALQAPAALVQKAHESVVPAETGAENTSIRLNSVMALRKLLKQRSDLVQVTVNDILILYRGLHAVRYTQSAALQQSIDALASDPRKEVQQARRMVLDEMARLNGKNPALLMPLDASRHDPRERIYPTTFRNPLTDFHEQHITCLNALRTYKAGIHGTRSAEFKTFYDTQLTYLRLIAGFGELLTRYRKIALAGQSTSTASIKFLGHLPPAVQKLLDTIPGKFDILNEIIKGEEVFSNMGRVAAGSSLRRFITAKDDNDQKTLAWGVLTDDKGVLHLSLRDFRPHVAVLQKLGFDDLARQIAGEYLDAYADGLNQYAAELREIVIASRETMTQQE
jgi:hypothetical protein